MLKGTTIGASSRRKFRTYWQSSMRNLQTWKNDCNRNQGQSEQREIHSLVGCMPPILTRGCTFLLLAQQWLRSSSVERGYSRSLTLLTEYPSEVTVLALRQPVIRIVWGFKQPSKGNKVKASRATANEVQTATSRSSQVRESLVSIATTCSAPQL
jgi:hypothetical protein